MGEGKLLSMYNLVCIQIHLHEVGKQIIQK